MSQLINTRSVIIQVLLIVAALSSMLFLFLPEFYNSLSLDDIVFYNDLQKTSILGFVRHHYLNWQGRYLGYIVNALQYRMYEWCGSTVPFAAIVYIVNIVLLYDILKMYARWNKLQTLMASCLIYALFVMCLPDISSYYWMCTKQYPMKVIMAIWLLAKIYFANQNKWYDWIALVVSACFVGCSTEVFAPMILVLLGIRILKLWRQKAYRIGELFKAETVLCIVFLIASVNFFAMVFSPGTFIRMEAHSDAVSLNYIEFVSEIVVSTVQIAKMVFFKLHYYIAFFVLMLALMSFTEIEKTLSARQLITKTMYNILVALGLLLLSMVLCQWACGQAFINRAFAQLPAAIYLLLFLLARDICRTKLLKNIRVTKLLYPGAIIVLVFILSNNIYSTCRAYPELEAYKESNEARLERLYKLQALGHTDVVFLEPLDGVEYHSIMDDLWRKIMPSYSKIMLFKSNEVANSVEQCYNVAFREYYKLDFDVISDLVYEGV